MITLLFQRTTMKNIKRAMGQGNPGFHDEDFEEHHENEEIISLADSNDKSSNLNEPPAASSIIFCPHPLF
jgi:hypothetical protein